MGLTLFQWQQNFMRDKSQQLRKRLAKKTKKGFRGYPMATLAAYGPDDQRASKLVASIVESEGAEPTAMQSGLLRTTMFATISIP